MHLSVYWHLLEELKKLIIFKKIGLIKKILVLLINCPLNIFELLILTIKYSD